MKCKINIFIFCLLLIISLVFSVSSYAHPGRTDAYGGHWDRRNGTYHFHTGEYAGRTQSDTSKNHFTPTRKLPESYDTYDLTDWLIAVIIFAVSIFIILKVFVYGFFLKKYLPKYSLDMFSEKISTYLQYRKEYSELTIKANELRKKIQIPAEYEIGKDNLPKEKGTDGWGKTFTVYTSYSGNKIHTSCGCYNAYKAKHICSFYPYHGFSARLCSKCSSYYRMPNLSWYGMCLKYQKYIKELKQIREEVPLLRLDLEKFRKRCNSNFFKFLFCFSPNNKKVLSGLNVRYEELKLDRHKTVKTALPTQ